MPLVPLEGYFYSVLRLHWKTAIKNQKLCFEFQVFSSHHCYRIINSYNCAKWPKMKIFETLFTQIGQRIAPKKKINLQFYSYNIFLFFLSSFEKNFNFKCYTNPWKNFKFYIFRPFNLSGAPTLYNDDNEPN
jgi:hypothetical protein